MLRAREKRRRLPGFLFEAQSPPLDEKLPRMDVAVFVGFASSGPLGVAVAVESIPQFISVFGQDAPLAWNKESGETVFTHLGAAVRAFFRNGGIRCWVIRVARTKALTKNSQNQARYNFFPLPNLLQARFDKEEDISFAPAFANARSEGSWSDALRVGTALISRPFEIIDGSIGRIDKRIIFKCRLFQSDELKVGESLRLTFKDKLTGRKFTLCCAVKEIEFTEIVSSSERKTFHISCDKLVWIDEEGEDILQKRKVGIKAKIWTSKKLSADSSDNPAVAFRKEVNAVLRANEIFFNQNSPPTEDHKVSLKKEISIDLKNITQEDAPPTGSLIVTGRKNRQLWLNVKSVSLNQDKAKPDEKNVRVTGRGFFLLRDAPITYATLNDYTVSAERLSFELWVKIEDEYALSLSDLALDSRHERFWGNLPTDEKYFRALLYDSAKTPHALWQSSGEQSRFPLSLRESEKGEEAKAEDRIENSLFIPLAMTALPENYLGAMQMKEATTLDRDGLASFDASLFLDEELKKVGTADLMNSAEYIRFLSDKPRNLRGIHAALSIEEATIISVPDALHKGWEKSNPQPAPSPPPSPFPIRPEWWSFLDCTERETKAEPVEEPRRENFLSCAIKIIKAPENLKAQPANPTSVFTLSWKSNLTDAKFVLEESAVETFNAAVQIYEGKEKNFTIYGKPEGLYYYRVRAEVGKDFSNWSNGIVVNVLPESNWQVSAKYEADVLLAVQRSLLRMCAGRGDLFAVMSLPSHYREDEAIEHISLLKSGAIDSSSTSTNVLPLGAGESKAFSYGAIYHPWLIAREDRRENPLTTMPPCGAACGVIAKRSLKRGAWIAPANESMSDVVALTPRISHTRYADTQDAQLNLIRQEPRGFMTLNEDTLSTEEDLLQINVRRLLMLLRRLALREGVKYVFEPNDTRLQRLVERNFSAFLKQMLERGAFAGKTAATSYQVVVGETINNAQSVEQGRFIVELRVAPSEPLRFMTVRLVQTGGRGFVTEV